MMNVMRSRGRRERLTISNPRCRRLPCNALFIESKNMSQLTSMLSGIKSVTNTDGFPLESYPPQGEVVVTFNDGNVHRMRTTSTDYQAAVKHLHGRPDVPRSAKAISHYFQVAHRFKIPADEVQALLDDIARHTLDVFHRMAENAD